MEGTRMRLGLDERSRYHRRDRQRRHTPATRTLQQFLSDTSALSGEKKLPAGPLGKPAETASERLESAVLTCIVRLPRRPEAGRAVKLAQKTAPDVTQHHLIQAVWSRTLS
jgi:hypothetical protein